MKTYANTVNGRAVVAPQTFESFNPATGEVIGLMPQCTAADVAQAVAAARAAQPAWAARPDAERKALLAQVAEVLRAHAELLRTDLYGFSKHKATTKRPRGSLREAFDGFAS